jgi:hypothetical protein
MTADGPSARAYHGAVRALSLFFIALGAVILVTTVASGGGPLSVGVMLGIAFAAVGAGRFWVASRGSGPGR